LTEVQLAPLFDPPTDQRELVRHYTLSEADITMIRQRRGDPNRLGSALMLCYLRYPGRPLQTGEQPAAALVSFVADQSHLQKYADSVIFYVIPMDSTRRSSPSCSTYGCKMTRY
jgi:TnpA family transposase